MFLLVITHRIKKAQARKYFFYNVFLKEERKIKCEHFVQQLLKNSKTNSEISRVLYKKAWLTEPSI